MFLQRAVSDMKVGDLVQIRHNQRHDLFMIVAVGKCATLANERWVEVLSLSTSRTWYEMMKDLRAVKICP